MARRALRSSSFQPRVSCSASAATDSAQRLGFRAVASSVEASHDPRGRRLTQRSWIARGPRSRDHRPLRDRSA